MNTDIPPGENLAHHDALVVQVRYLAAGKPYVEAHASEAETLAILKPRALHHFGLVEGDADGGRKEYSFSFKGIIQTDLGVTLGALAKGEHRIELTLLEQFIQG